MRSTAFSVIPEVVRIDGTHGAIIAKPAFRAAISVFGITLRMLTALPSLSRVDSRGVGIVAGDRKGS